MPRQTKIELLRKELKETDVMLARFIEDLTALLIQKTVLCYAEINPIIHQRMFNRRRTRYELKKLLLLEELDKDFYDST